MHPVQPSAHLEAKGSCSGWFNPSALITTWSGIAGTIRAASRFALLVIGPADAGRPPIDGLRRTARRPSLAARGPSPLNERLADVEREMETSNSMPSSVVSSCNKDAGATELARDAWCTAKVPTLLWSSSSLWIFCTTIAPRSMKRTQYNEWLERVGRTRCNCVRVLSNRIATMLINACQEQRN